jgi:hypothetical protein
MKKIIFLVILTFWVDGVLAQSNDSTQIPSFFKGQITATNNGVSLIPNFSLNKPALLFDLSLGKGRLSFDPMIRFAMNGKPWAFVFWWRYKLVNRKKFNMGLGAHPAFMFRSETITIGGVQKELLTTQRYVAWEASPNFRINQKLSLGMYYIGSHGLTKDLIQWGSFVAARAFLSDFIAPKSLNTLFIPQVYWLKQDIKSGTYWNATLNISKKKSPLMLNGIVSQPIRTKIVGKNFLWSVGLVYNINNKYRKI